MNRRWQRPNPTLHPAIYHSKGVIAYVETVLQRKVYLYCDFHGHSRKKNIFLFGCNAAESWNPRDALGAFEGDSEGREEEHLVIWIISTF